MTPSSDPPGKVIVVAETHVDLVVALARALEGADAVLQLCCDATQVIERMSQGGVHGIIVSIDLRGSLAILAEARAQWPDLVRVASGPATSKTLRAVVDSGLAELAIGLPASSDDLAVCRARIAPQRQRWIRRALDRVGRWELGPQHPPPARPRPNGADTHSAA